VKTGHERGDTEVAGQPFSFRPDLLELDAELAAMEGLIDATPGGGRLLAIEGPPGIGKTALIAEAKKLAQEAGLEVLGARGSELERSFAHGVVRQLFEPFLASLPEDEQAELLSGAAALAKPLFDPAQIGAEPATDSSLATLHGLYWLAVNIVARRPLVLTVDDLHWCDLPSLRWLAYVLPRMEGFDLLVIVGLRPAEPGEDPGLLGHIVSDPLATVIRPAPLSAEATRLLLRDALTPDAEDGFCAACQEATGGNPLLLHELARAISAEGMAATEVNVPRLDELGARAFWRAVSVRLASLPPEAGRLAQAVAILGDDADPGQVAALADLDRQAASVAAGALARVDILGPQPPFVFVHPLIAELLLELGSAEARVSGEAAIQHLQEAHGLIEDPIRRAEAALLLGRQLFILQGEEADAVFTTALDELAGADAELEHLLEAGLITNDLFTPGLHSGALERLDRIRSRLPVGETVGEKLLLSLLAYHDARAGAPADETIALARRALAEGTLVQGDVTGAALVPSCTVLAMADLDEVLRVYEDALAEAHRRGSIFAFAVVKVFRAQTLVWRGDLGEAEADAREALAAAEAWGASARFSGHAAAFLADALMEQGKLDDAAASLSRAGLGESLPDSARQLYLGDSSARLRLLRGDLAGGLQDLLDAGRRFEAVGSRNPAFIAWRSQAALALLRLGEQDEGRRLVDEELALARTWGAPRALGAALRAAGLIEGGTRGLALLEEAVQVLSKSAAKLEHAKSRTELGAALRRANRRSQAREQLRQAVELAAICGAASLAARAESELLATGARPRRIALSGVASLTPSERRVAEMAAEGLTNREIAQALFIAPRTVEVHLTSIYRKLRIRSRSQLPAVLAESILPNERS
jgi:DNA-binding CsgD family transcriptional regulator